MEIRGDEVLFRMGNLRWRIRGMAKNLSLELLKVNVLVARIEEDHSVSSDAGAFHVCVICEPVTLVKYYAI